MNPSTPPLFEIAVIGAGGAGQMAILRAVLNHLNTLLFVGNADTIRKSRATWVAEVDNIPGMFDKKKPISATTQETIRFIQSREDLKDLLTIVKCGVETIQKENNEFVFHCKSGTYRAKYVVLCTGTMDLQPHIQGSIKPILPYANRGDVYYCIRCDGHKTAGHACAVIGERPLSGNIAIKLKERYNLPKITILTHGKPFQGDTELRQLLKEYHVDIVEGEITDIIGDPKTGLQGFRVDGHGEVKATKAFAMLGSIIYNELAKQLGVKLHESGQVLVNEVCETSVSGFFAAGDLVYDKKNQVYTAWDMAVDAVDEIDARVRASRRQNARQK